MADWEEVFIATEPMEAEMVKGLLESAGIPVVIEARGLQAMPGIFGHGAPGQLRLKVPPDQVDLALAILRAESEDPGDPEDSEE
jgi:hypothetical protein